MIAFALEADRAVRITGLSQSLSATLCTTTMRPLIVAITAAAAAVAQFTSQVTRFGANSLRVQIAAPGNAISNPPLQALLDVAPMSATASFGSGITDLTNGNLAVTVDAATGFITARRVSDGVLLLQQTALKFDTPNVPGTRAGSASALVSFSSSPDEHIYGLGEHRTGNLQMRPYHKRFADSQDYSQSRGGDVSIPWYASSKGYGFVWNSPAYGFVDVSNTAITWFANATLGVDVWITTTDANFTAASGVSPYAGLLRQYVDAVGHASKMPYFSTGFIQCKDRCVAVCAWECSSTHTGAYPFASMLLSLIAGTATRPSCST